MLWIFLGISWGLDAGFKISFADVEATGESKIWLIANSDDSMYSGLVFSFNSGAVNNSALVEGCSIIVLELFPTFSITFFKEDYDYWLSWNLIIDTYWKVIHKYRILALDKEGSRMERTLDFDSYDSGGTLIML